MLNYLSNPQRFMARAVERRDEGRGAVEVEVQLRHAVQLASPAGDLVLKFGRAVEDRHMALLRLTGRTLRPRDRERALLCHFGVT